MWYILPIGGLYATYHLLREPKTTIDIYKGNRSTWLVKYHLTCMVGIRVSRWQALRSSFATQVGDVWQVSVHGEKKCWTKHLVHQRELEVVLLLLDVIRPKFQTTFYFGTTMRRNFHKPLPPPKFNIDPKMVVGKFLLGFGNFSGENSLFNFAGVPVTSRAGPLSRSYPNNIQVYRGFKKPDAEQNPLVPGGLPFHQSQHLFHPPWLTLDIGTFTPYKNKPGKSEIISNKSYNTPRVTTCYNTPKTAIPLPTYKKDPLYSLVGKGLGCVFQFGVLVHNLRSQLHLQRF